MHPSHALSGDTGHLGPRATPVPPVDSSAATVGVCWGPLRRVRPLIEPGRLLGRLVRYGTVSAVTTSLSLSIFGVLLTLTPWPAPACNFVASCAGIGPSYLLNRRWVWRRRDRAVFWKETAPFWAMSVAGLVASTVTVSVVAGSVAGWAPGARTAAELAANLAAFASLWLVEFLVIDRLLFGRRRRAPAGRAGAPPGGLNPTRPADHGDRGLQLGVSPDVVAVDTQVVMVERAATPGREPGERGRPRAHAGAR